MKPALLVLAAGMGSRYGGLKQLDHFGPSGETIIDYSVFDALQAGFEKVVFVIRRSMTEDFEEIVAGKYRNKMDVRIAYQEMDILPKGYSVNPERVKPLGTGHAVWCAKDELQEPFAVINADDFYGRDAFAVVADFLKKVDPIDLSHQALVGYVLNNTLSENGFVSRGVCEVSPENILLSITERTEIVPMADGAALYREDGVEYPLTGNETVSMNMMGFTPAALESFDIDLRVFLEQNGGELKKEFYLPFVMNNLIQRGEAEVSVLHTSSKWFGVTYPEDKAAVSERINQLVEAGKYPGRLWECMIG